MKIERLLKKKAQEKRKLLGEFENIKVAEKDILDKDILRMHAVLDTINPDKSAPNQASSHHSTPLSSLLNSRYALNASPKNIPKTKGNLQTYNRSKSPQQRGTHNIGVSTITSMTTSNSPSKIKTRTLRPGVSLFSEKVGSRLEPAGLPRIEGLSISAHNSRLFIFGGERCGLCSNDLFVFDVLDLSAVN